AEDSPREVEMEMLGMIATIPFITNYDEAQAIDANQTFVLSWNGYNPLMPNAYLTLVINDEFGNTMFSAPNACIPRDLAPEATEVTIPANTLRPGRKYLGTLQFGYNFYSSTNDVPGYT